MRSHVVIIGVVLVVLSWGSLGGVAELLYRPAQAEYQVGCLPAGNASLDAATCARMSAELDRMAQAALYLGVLGFPGVLIILFGLALHETIPRLRPPPPGRSDAEVLRAEWEERTVSRNVRVVAFAVILALVAAVAWSALVSAIVLGSFTSLLLAFWRRLTPRRLNLSFAFSAALALFLVGYSVWGILGVIVAGNVAAMAYGMLVLLTAGEF